MWLNGRWFPQIVDRDSGNISIQYLQGGHKAFNKSKVSGPMINQIIANIILVLDLC